ncbi:unnamed protein product [Porites lobata]|uniref:Uncharacterized protein n=1 Tax=Porites lobata TaxID=104759 RepID=A0ABN8QM96_9CNID|nr:unnamed protein product [Porites lobata]
MVEEHHHVTESFDEAPKCEKNSPIDMNEYGSRKGLDHREVTSIIMYVSTGLVVLMIVAGGVWNLMKTRNLPRKKEGNVGDHGSVEMNATEEEIEIRVIKEDKDVRRSLEAPSTTEVQLE